MKVKELIEVCRKYSDHFDIEICDKDGKPIQELTFKIRPPSEKIPGQLISKVYIVNYD